MDGYESQSRRGGRSFQNRWHHSVAGDTKGHCEQKKCMETINLTQTQKTDELASYVFSGILLSAARETREKGRTRRNLSKVATVCETNGSTSNTGTKNSMTPCNAFVVTTCTRIFIPQRQPPLSSYTLWGFQSRRFVAVRQLASE